MTITVAAVYESGVLKPEAPFNLKEGSSALPKAEGHASIRRETHREIRAGRRDGSGSQSTRIRARPRWPPLAPNSLRCAGRL
jgi:predicted DNA-binding antitoxin AbrB/MazE fold protein